MKRLFNLIFCSATFFAVSCADLLDVQPDGQIQEEDIFASKLLVEQYLNSCYQGFPVETFKYGWQSNLIIALSDDGYDATPHGTHAETVIYGGLPSTKEVDNALIYNTHNGGDKWMFAQITSWDLFFQNIARCNVFLANINIAEGLTDTEREMYEGEIRVVRAYYYYELMMRFGEVPIFKGAEGEIDDVVSIRKNTIPEVANFIISECRDVIKNNNSLPWRHSSDNMMCRHTKGVASAIKSRTALYFASPLFSNGSDENWAFAEEVTKESLEECLANGYGLFTGTGSTVFSSAYQEYQSSTYKLTGGASDNETILPSTATNLGNDGRVGQSASQLGGVRAGVCPVQELVDAYPMADGSYVLDLENPYTEVTRDGYVFLDPNYSPTTTYDPENPYENRDPRFYATINYNGKKALGWNKKIATMQIYTGGASAITPGVQKFTMTGYYQYRTYHPLYTNGAIYQPTWRIFQLNEMYLNYAECAAACNHLTEARDAVKPLRDRVQMPNIPSTGDKEEMLRYVRQERRIELAWTGRRYDDLRRFGTIEEPMNEIRYPQAMWIDKVGNKFVYTRAPIGVQYDVNTGKFSGNQRQKLCYEAKYRLHPLSMEEATRLEMTTGVNWQNPGW